MLYIPQAVAEDYLSLHVLKHELYRSHQGKVRDTWDLPGHPDKLFIVATKRLSISDFVLGRTVPLKGEILTAVSILGFTNILADIPNHLVAYGPDMDQYLPKALRGLPELQKCAIIVSKKDMLPRECIARAYLTGTGLTSYKETGMVCGHMLPEGLHDGSKLDPVLFTPTTKAKVGHDLHVTAQSVFEEYGEMPSKITLDVFRRMSEFALARGIIVADMKIELALDGTLADEAPSPDSCRFWDLNDYKIAAAQGKSPSGYDKEPVRQAGKIAVIDDKPVDISKLKVNLENAKLVGRWEVPNNVIGETTERYLTIQHRLSGMSLPEFQQNIMNIR